MRHYLLRTIANSYQSRFDSSVAPTTSSPHSSSRKRVVAIVCTIGGLGILFLLGIIYTLYLRRLRNKHNSTLPQPLDTSPPVSTINGTGTTQPGWRGTESAWIAGQPRSSTPVLHSSPSHTRTASGDMVPSTAYRPTSETNAFISSDSSGTALGPVPPIEGVQNFIGNTFNDIHGHQYNIYHMNTPLARR
jgi:hypothetical protein